MFRNTGARSKYRAEFADQAYKYSLLGAKTADLARLFEVAESTVKKWLNEHDEFAVAVRDGGELADANVANQLYRRATGFSKTSRKVKRGPRGREVTTESVYYPPDVQAAQFWLKNRNRENWRDRQDHAVTVSESPIDLSHLDAEERATLRAILRKHRAPVESPATDEPRTLN